MKKLNLSDNEEIGIKAWELLANGLHNIEELDLSFCDLTSKIVEIIAGKLEQIPRPVINKLNSFTILYLLLIL